MLFENQETVLLPSEARTEIYQVSQLNNNVKQMLEMKYQNVWIEGEISNLSQPQSGHIYLTLKDASAQIKGAFFKQSQRSSNMKLQHGQQVLVKAKVSLYAPRGDYQLIISYIEPAGAGRLQQEFEALKLKLANEGLFNSEIKKRLPVIPKAIGIVTSATGAALQDVLNILSRRFPFVPVIIYPCLVQGSTAAPSIVAALEAANRRAETDVLIVGRGGGSLEDLWPFNEEIVARAIFTSSIPIISAVGHQTDITISDFVADLRAPTPSAAAEIVVPELNDILMQFCNYEERLKKALSIHIQQARTKLTALARHIKHPQSKLEDQMQRLDSLQHRLIRAIHFNLQAKQQKIEFLKAQTQRLQPLHLIQQKRQQILNLEKSLHKNIHLKISNNHTQLIHLKQRLLGLGPQKTLERGFSIAQDEKGKVIHSKSELLLEQKLSLHFQDGHVQVIVLKI